VHPGLLAAGAVLLAVALLLALPLNRRRSRALRL
jgi:hypothetical protein